MNVVMNVISLYVIVYIFSLLYIYFRSKLNWKIYSAIISHSSYFYWLSTLGFEITTPFYKIKNLFLFLLFIVFIISTILCILLYPTSTQQRYQTGGKLGKNVYYFIIFLILAIIKIIYFPRFNFNFFYK